MTTATAHTPPIVTPATPTPTTAPTATSTATIHAPTPAPAPHAPPAPRSPRRSPSLADALRLLAQWKAVRRGIARICTDRDETCESEVESRIFEEITYLADALTGESAGAEVDDDPPIDRSTLTAPGEHGAGLSVQDAVELMIRFRMTMNATDAAAEAADMKDLIVGSAEAESGDLSNIYDNLVLTAVRREADRRSAAELAASSPRL